MQARDVRFLTALAVPLAGVGLVTAVLVAADADLAVAALCFVPVVAACALLGALAAGVSVVAAFVATNYFFTPPRHSLTIDKTQDLVALVAFAVVAAVVSATIARVNLLRQRAVSQRREAAARLELTNRLAAGEDPEPVAASAGEILRGLLGFDRCDVDVDAAGRLTVNTDPDAALLPADERALFQSFVNGLAASFDQVRLAREARVARQDAATEQTRAGFLAAMTHNLRTPLASIGAAASVLLDPTAGLDRDREVELLETVRGEADRLDRLVTKVLLLGRIQSGGVCPEPEPVEVEELVHAAAGRLRLLGLGRVDLDAAADLPTVMVDRTLVEVALVNVLENALRYSSVSSPVQIVLRAEADRVAVRVVDHGPGVPAADRERVFERFERGREVDDAVGAGIGLAITREFVEAHGGSCRLEETPGGGATVIMTLPVVSAAS